MLARLFKISRLDIHWRFSGPACTDVLSPLPQLMAGTEAVASHVILIFFLSLQSLAMIRYL